MHVEVYLELPKKVRKLPFPTFVEDLVTALLCLVVPRFSLDPVPVVVLEDPPGLVNPPWEPRRPMPLWATLETLAVVLVVLLSEVTLICLACQIGPTESVMEMVLDNSFNNHLFLPDLCCLSVPTG